MPGNTFAAWPFDKIDRNRAVPTQGRRCVLLTTGALNPVHLGHVAMFDSAKIALEADFGFEIVGGFVSPSHDLFLAGKHRRAGKYREFYSTERRLAMCAAATKDHPFLTVGAWESSVVGYWPDFPEVTEELVSALKHRYSEDSPEVLYLCGEDHLRFARNSGLPGVCVVPRSGRTGMTDESRNIYAIARTPDDVYDEMSATRVRKALLNNDVATLRSHLHPEVLALLREYPLECGLRQADGRA